MLWSAAPDYCSRPWLDFADMTMEQANGWGWATAIYPDDRDGLLECWRSCLASGIPFDMEARMCRFDGAYRWFLFRANPLRDESGKIVRWYGTNLEIEDRKQSEDVLQANELSWRQIIDNIPGYVHTTSAAGEAEVLEKRSVMTQHCERRSNQIRILAVDDNPAFRSGISGSLINSTGT
jgi:PAS domain S-box-containing protein